MAEYKNRSIDRAARILDCLGEADNPLGLSELSEIVDINKATLFRLLEVLQGIHYVHRNPKSGRYTIGYRIFRIGRTRKQIESLVRDIRPILHRISIGLNETVMLAGIAGTEVIYYEKVQARAGASVPVSVGMSLNAHATALGKALLAFRPDDEVRQMFQHYHFRQHTKNTITDFSVFRSELNEVRERGYALDNAEMYNGVHCVAVPLVNTLGRATLAISVSRPTSRSTEPPPAEIARHLKWGADELYKYRTNNEPPAQAAEKN